MNVATTPNTMPVKDICKVLGISRTTLYRYISQIQIRSAIPFLLANSERTSVGVL